MTVKGRNTVQLADLAGKSGLSGEDKPNFGLRGPNPETASRGERVREAVGMAGGNKVVADKTGISLTTLQNYLKGSEMKLSNALAIAELAGVSLEWLSAGHGPMRPGEMAAGPSEPQKAAPAAPFGDIDVDRLQAALTAALQALPAGRRPDIDTRRFAQILALLYAIAGDPPR